MRLFIFLVGGTGSRVMRPLIMQLAAGIHPLNETGQPMPLEIVPIIVDPHKANQDLKRTENLLRWYKQIRQQLYGDSAEVTRGFFSAKISTLSDIIPNGSGLSDTFLFNMGSIASKKFQDFISYSTLDSANQALASMMFSGYQLDTKMDIGFVGSPNIGSVALNQFKDSEEFRQFSNVFQKTDRIFIVSSIFGGTGAAGYPIIVKNIRNAGRNAAINNRGDLRDAKIGALTVLPYFNVQQDENSPISRADFISKTKSALFYYHDNLTGLREDGVDLPFSKVNACYYLGDEVPSNPYFNDPGGNGQRNDAHVVEYVGALSVLDFLSIPDDQLVTVDGNARSPIYKEYGLSEDKGMLSLKTFALSTRSLVNRQLVKFHLAYMYITHQLKQDIGRGYTEDKPEIGNGFLSTSFFNTLTASFFVAYRQWLKELRGNHRAFIPFNLDTEKLSEAISGIQPKSGLFKSAIDYKTLLSALNKASQQAMKTNKYGSDRVAFKLLDLLDETLDQLLDEKYNGIV
ncbi:hypothetical protein C7120_11500 [Prevotella sp. oral taxon 376]|nr:hypothetical protein C7120_11500 [Prevotella sp. oral taxon 376]